MIDGLVPKELVPMRLRGLVLERQALRLETALMMVDGSVPER